MDRFVDETHRWSPEQYAEKMALLAGLDRESSFVFVAPICNAPLGSPLSPKAVVWTAPFG